jgi:hypothetical protein
MQLLLEASDKLGPSVRNDGLQYPMQTQDVRNIQLNDYPNGVKLAAGERQAHNEIHTNVFPFPGRNTQRLEQSSRPHVISHDPSTCVAFRNIVSSLALHTGPPKLCLQIMIHLCAARVDGIFESVSFIKYLPAQLVVLWNH